jgi:hypothetical protein
MNRTEHLLSILAEECVEVAQRATKALRFGLTEIQPGQDKDNAERILVEVADLLATLDMLTEEGHLRARYVTDEMIQAKKDRIEHYFKRSRECGAMTEVVQKSACDDHGMCDCIHKRREEEMAHKAALLETRLLEVCNENDKLRGISHG